jgi:hypothetical protein
MEPYKTIQGTATAEYEEKKSRFIGQVAHVETEEEAVAFLDGVRTANCFPQHEDGQNATARAEKSVEKACRKPAKNEKGGVVFVNRGYRHYIFLIFIAKFIIIP